MNATKDYQENELEEGEMYLVTIGTRLFLGRFCQKGFRQPYFETKDSIIFVEEANKIEKVSSLMSVNIGTTSQFNW